MRISIVSRELGYFHFIMRVHVLSDSMKANILNANYSFLSHHCKNEQTKKEEPDLQFHEIQVVNFHNFDVEFSP